jgi:hypothetical protein
VAAVHVVVKAHARSVEPVPEALGEDKRGPEGGGVGLKKDVVVACKRARRPRVGCGCEATLPRPLVGALRPGAQGAVFEAAVEHRFVYEEVAVCQRRFERGQFGKVS